MKADTLTLFLGAAAAGRQALDDVETKALLLGLGLDLADGGSQAGGALSVALTNTREFGLILAPASVAPIANWTRPISARTGRRSYLTKTLPQPPTASQTKSYRTVTLVTYQ